MVNLKIKQINDSTYHIQTVVGYFLLNNANSWCEYSDKSGIITIFANKYPKAAKPSGTVLADSLNVFRFYAYDRSNYCLQQNLR